MPRIDRKKACIVCASSKRKCDKQIPECQRCLDRDVDCVYPQPRRRRRDIPLLDPQIKEFALVRHDMNTHLQFTDPFQLGLEDWSTAETGTKVPEFCNVPLDSTISLSPAISPLGFDFFSHSTSHENDVTYSTTFPWFLQGDTWVMQHGTDAPTCASFSELEPFIHVVEDMFKSWIKDGYNAFIHRRLYAKGMPTCLQDAFTTLAAYNSRSPNMKETILQIAEDRASKLIRQNSPSAAGLRGIAEHLARVHALFTYQFIQLFDGSIRFRASSEQRIPILRDWILELWKAAKQSEWDLDTPYARSLDWSASELEAEYEVSSKMWRLWSLTESVRRSQVIIDTVLNIYQIMTKGWAECSGAVMFTAGRGMWEAESSVKWFEMSRTKLPLLVPSLRPESLMSKYPAEQVDDFIKMFWKFLVGHDKIQFWIDRSEQMSRR